MTRSDEPIHLVADVHDAAVAAAALTTRSVSQQVEHRVRIGQELGVPERVDGEAISEVRTGTSSYDGLGEREQAIVCAEWAKRMSALRSELDYSIRFAALGEAWSELDDDGGVIVHPARG